MIEVGLRVLLVRHMAEGQKVRWRVVFSLTEPCLSPEGTVWNRWVQDCEGSVPILFCSVPHPAVGRLFDREVIQTQTPCCTDANTLSARSRRKTHREGGGDNQPFPVTDGWTSAFRKRDDGKTSVSYSSDLKWASVCLLPIDR